MKIWCVDYSGTFDSHMHSVLFLSEEEAKEWYEKFTYDGVYRKMYQVEDIWGFAARNFEQVIINLITAHTDDEGNTHIWNEEGESLEEKIAKLAKQLDIQQFSYERWLTFDNPGIDIYAFSAAWVHEGELHHFNDTWQIF